MGIWNGQAQLILYHVRMHAPLVWSIPTQCPQPAQHLLMLYGLGHAQPQDSSKDSNLFQQSLAVDGPSAAQATASLLRCSAIPHGSLRVWPPPPNSPGSGES